LRLGTQAQDVILLDEDASWSQELCTISFMSPDRWLRIVYVVVDYLGCFYLDLS